MTDQMTGIPRSLRRRLPLRPSLLKSGVLLGRFAGEMARDRHLKKGARNETSGGRVNDDDLIHMCPGYGTIHFDNELSGRMSKRIRSRHQNTAQRNGRTRKKQRQNGRFWEGKWRFRGNGTN